MAQIAITPARTLGKIDRNLFGCFAEQPGRCR
jgi:alpha-L-arabinofuranosidase